MKIEAVHPQWTAMNRSWALPEALLGGTMEMQAKGETYLPKHAEEPQTLYDRRLRATVLFNAYGETLRRLSGKPFNKPVTIKGAAPEWTKAIEKNCDRAGSNLTTWARARYRDAMHFGQIHAIVDFPSEGAEFRMQEEKGIVHPYFVFVTPASLRYWVHNDSGNLVEARIWTHRESITDDGTEYVQRITRWTPLEVEHYESVQNAWVRVDGKEHSFGRVPIRTLQFNRTGNMTATPCLEDLAYQNLQHWQSTSDHRGQLAFSRRSALMITGLTSEEYKLPVYFGAGATIKSTNSDAKGFLLEHSGQAIKASSEDLKETESRMTWLGLSPLMERSGAQTATAHVINADGSHSDAQSWAVAEGIWLTELLQDAGNLIRSPISEDVRAEVFTDFGLTARTQQDLDALYKAKALGEISSATFLAEIKRRGVLSDSVNIEEEVEAAKAEAPKGEAADFEDDDE